MPKNRKNNRIFDINDCNPFYKITESINTNVIEIEDDKKTKIPYKKDIIETIQVNKINHELYKNIGNEYKKIYGKLKNSPKAYRIVFLDYPDLIFFNFSKERNPVKWAAYKYFREQMHPAFTRDSSNFKEMRVRTYRVPEFDKYFKEEKIPIPELMEKQDIIFKCSICGKGNFTYESYKNKGCFILEGEGDLNDFTKGYVLCHQCYQKYLNIR